MKVKHFLFAFAATIMAACTNETNELQKTEGDFQVFGEVLIDGKPADLSRASGGSWSGLGKYRGKDYATVSYTAPSGFTVTEIREEPDKTSSSSSSHSFDINNKDHTVYVDLDEIAKEYTITVSAGNGGSVSPTSFSGPSGTKRTITATPQSGFTFSSWSASGVSLSSSTSASTTATIGSSNGTITANFKEDTPTVISANAYLTTSGYRPGGSSCAVRAIINNLPPDHPYIVITVSCSYKETSATAPQTKEFTLSVNSGSNMSDTYSFDIFGGFTFETQPYITNISPSSGTLDNGDQFTISW